MTKADDIQPYYNELPSHFADRLGVHYTETVTAEHKKSNGQYFTPIGIANLMSSMCDIETPDIRILDPGCGTAILTCSLIEHLVKHNSNLNSIDLVTYETDVDLIASSQQVLQYLKKWLKQRDIVFKYLLHIEDFILDNADAITNAEHLFTKRIECFDVIISNPPYFKLSNNDKRTLAAKEIVSGQPNIYSFFMGVAAKLLKPNGQLIFITPRSFTSGNYFKSFREFFFKEVQLQRIHLFVSRKDTFGRDNVLQETVILKATKKVSANKNPQVMVSSSHGLIDIATPSVKYFSHNDLIDIHSKEKFLHLPTNDIEESILEIFKFWTGTLRRYNIQISTGPVVSFRAWDYIQDSFENGKVFLAPLFWLHNVTKMVLIYPVPKPNKGQYLRIEVQTKSILIPNKNYILLRRFSSKDDTSRLIAAPYFCNFIESDYIGVENKVNYIYRKNGHLERNEVVGLCALLNSQLFDSFFRIFNGNVNVSATELREMTFPPLETIKAIGSEIILSNNFSAEHVNDVVNEYFETANILNEYEQS
ncbi:MAG TPA: Eco57I restriction-modification methylase domain-containing protein [Bacteroidia bacterium]|nr:Eco57I restriction-modification methylase domain-containing protein [Bacteroidia bacterium]